MKRVVALYRVSTKGQVEKDDIPMQKTECRRFAALHDDWQLVKEVCEKGVSGFKVSSQKRDAIQSIKADAVNKKFDILLVYMFDRLGRKDDETPFVVEWFARQGIEVWSVMEGQQRFENHVDKLMNYLRYWQASGESIKTGIRVRTKQEQMTQDGVYRGGPIPYGYKLVPSDRVNKKGHPLKDVAIDEDRAPIVRLIFEKYVYEGYGIHRLANYLNDSFPGDKIWHPTSINTVLRNSSYTGRFHFDEIQSEPMEHLRVIPDELFNQVEDIMKSRATREPVKQRGTIPLRTNGQYLLTGLLYCGDCGSRMTGSVAHKKYVSRTGEVTRNERRIYRCYGKFITATQCRSQSTYSAERLEKAVDAVVREYLATFRSSPFAEVFKKAKREADRKARQKRDEAQKRLSALERDVALLKDEVLRSLAGASAFDRDELNALLLEKRGALSEAQSEVERLNEGASDNTADNAERDYQQMTSWAQQYPDANIEVKRMILTHLIEYVKVRRGYELEIRLTVTARQFFGVKGEDLTIMDHALGSASDQSCRSAQYAG